MRVCAAVCLLVGVLAGVGILVAESIVVGLSVGVCVAVGVWVGVFVGVGPGMFSPRHTTYTPFRYGLLSGTLDCTSSRRVDCSDGACAQSIDTVTTCDSPTRTSNGAASDHEIHGAGESREIDVTVRVAVPEL